MSQQDIANIIGYSQSTVSNVENYTHNYFHSDVLSKIEKVLGLTHLQLLLESEVYVRWFVLYYFLRNEVQGTSEEDYVKAFIKAKEVFLRTVKVSYLDTLPVFEDESKKFLNNLFKVRFNEQINKLG